MENETTIIRRFPLPIKEINSIEPLDETSLVQEVNNSESGKDSQVPDKSVRNTVALSSDSNTKMLNFSAEEINAKLARAELNTTAAFSYSSYVGLITIDVAAIGITDTNGTYLVIPYSNGLFNSGNIIFNFKLRTNNGVVISHEMTCISGELKNVDLVLTKRRSSPRNFILFAKSNNFQGTLKFKEQAFYCQGIGAFYMNYGEQLSNLNDYEIVDRIKYRNIASNVVGLNLFTMKINKLPTNKSDLFSSLFGEGGNGLENAQELFRIPFFGDSPSIVLTSSNDSIYASILTSTRIVMVDGGDSYNVSLNFAYGGLFYFIEFSLGDDGIPIPGSEGVIIR